jgi:hypothetical protein
MATTADGTPYVESSDLVANYPAVSLALANQIDLQFNKLELSFWPNHTATLTFGTIGNGTISTQYAEYGTTIIYKGQITWGSTSALPSGAGDTLSVDLPFNSRSTNRTAQAAYSELLDVSAGEYLNGTCVVTGADSLSLFHNRPNATYANTTTRKLYNTTATPLTLASGDAFRWIITYERS